MEQIFRWAINEALAETELPEAVIPQGILHTLDQIADRSFLPGIEIVQPD